MSTSYVCQMTDLYSLKRGICSKYWCLLLKGRKRREKGEGRRERGRKTANEARKGTCIYLVLSLCLSGFWKAGIFVPII